MKSMDIVMVTLAMGLPGSGKTHTLSDVYPAMLGSTKYVRNLFIDLDNKEFDADYILKTIEAVKKRDTYSYGGAVGYNLVVDTLILSNASIKKLIVKLSLILNLSNIDLHIIWFKPDIDSCLYNDLGRRKKSSANIIKHAVLEEVDTIKLANELEGIVKTVSVIQKDVERKDEIFTYDLCNDDDTMIYSYFNSRDYRWYIESESWDTGGNWCDCWGNTGTYYSEEPPYFTELYDIFLEEIELTEEERNYIEEELVIIVEEREPDYYGGCRYFSYKTIDLKDLLDYLVSIGKIERHEI